jgi:hypothetical protein
LNNLQLYIAVAIPSVLVILAWISSNVRQTTMERRMDSFGLRMEKRMDSFDSRMEAKFERLEAKMDRRFDGVLDGIGGLRERVAVVESKQQ